MKDNIISLPTGYTPTQPIVKMSDLQELQAQLTYMADELVLLSKTVQALTTYLKSARANK